MTTPRIRGGGATPPPWPLNQIPRAAVVNIAKRLIYEVRVNAKPVIEGTLWERIFAESIGAEWQNSTSALADVQLKNCGWTAKALGVHDPLTVNEVKLISGRNNIIFSFPNYSDKVVRSGDPDDLGSRVLDIWNERVSRFTERHEHLRSVVLLKGKGLSRFGLFEFNTIRYQPELFSWQWNDKGNLNGYDRRTSERRFLWQMNGSQFSIYEKVPDERICFQIEKPEPMSLQSVLDDMGFTTDWIKFLK